MLLARAMAFASEGATSPFTALLVPHALAASNTSATDRDRAATRSSILLACAMLSYRLQRCSAGQTRQGRRFASRAHCVANMKRMSNRKLATY
jgi:hypothetical protein